ncbi:MAG: DEAD/DEAH box helicase [Euryarchaeota archaeon]|nr:DEAD/DEAH box helicase [Euryarchaeota archaeon]
MNVEKLIIDPEIRSILKEQGIAELYPPQAEALPIALHGDHLVLSVPTACGKSLVAYLTIVIRLKALGGKALYVVPLRALAREKYDELKEFERLGFKVALATGDLDDSDLYLSRYDIIVCTSEKADSLLRHGISWLSKVRVLVVDEIHLIQDPTRGPTLEVIIARFKALNPDTQILALSATIKNAVELADWLSAKLVSSTWRPVPLKEGVCFRDKIFFNDGSTKKIDNVKNDSVEWLIEDSLSTNGQVLIFVNARRSTVSLAKRLSPLIFKNLSESEKKEAKKLVKSLRNDISEVTSVETSLASCIEHGVAFHHAGLDSGERRLVEQGFKDRIIKCIVATPTLAAGVNTPARRVIIRDLWRYDMNFGMRPIPILEYKQQAGRAGRPRYDKEGEAITIAKNQEQKDRIFSDYILGETEPIYSKLGTQPALRMHVLSAIATKFVEDEAEIERFLNSTFLSYQTDVSRLRAEIDTTLGFLLEHQFIEPLGSKYVATLFGTRTSSMYIDPLSAVQLKGALENAEKKEATSLSYLHAICSTPDLHALYLRASDTWVDEKAELHRAVFLLDPPVRGSSEYEWFLSALKTACLLENWIDEVSEDKMVTAFDVGPGDIHTIVDKAQWLLYATREFARTYAFSQVSEIGDLILRVQHGCKKELVNLVSLRGIGRVRARALYGEGFKTIHDLRDVPLQRLAEIKTIGKTVAESIKKQIGENAEKGIKQLKEFSIHR